LLADLLNETLFRSLGQARRLIEVWRQDYNHHRPHSKLGWLTRRPATQRSGGRTESLKDPLPGIILLYSCRRRRNTQKGIRMRVRKFATADASFERSPGQEGDVFAANMVDQRHGGPITIGFGRYGPNQVLKEILAVDDVMVILEGRLSVSTDLGEIIAEPGEMVYMPKGEKVTIRSHDQGAVTAYVTCPHWQEQL
jgi:ethanolamine utilization protein EutQ (cupin superfamily)